MTRGIRGATTVQVNTEAAIVAATKTLLEALITKNNVVAESISHVFFSATDDLDACFPAKALREIAGFKHVPVMCMQEMVVADGLAQCIRIMMVVQTEQAQADVTHVYHNEAMTLRPDLRAKKGEGS